MEAAFFINKLLLMKLFNLYTYAFLCTLIISCNNSDNKVSKDFPTLEFNIQNNLIEKETIINNLEISISSPINWLLTNQENINEVKLIFEEMFSFENNFKYLLENIFIDDDNSSMLALGKVFINDTLSFIEFNNLYVKELKKNNNEINSSIFYKENILVSQLLINSENKINFRLFFENRKNEIIQVDYITSVKNYANEVKSIESSIGSIKLINQ